MVRNSRSPTLTTAAGVPRMVESKELTMPNQLQILFVALAIAYSPCGYLIAQIQNQVDRDETIRRGDMVTRAGSGPRDAGIGAIADAMAPPAAPTPAIPSFEIPPTPQQPQQVNAIALLVTALSTLLGGSLTNFLLLGILAMQGWRYYRTKSGLPTTLNDEQYTRLIEVLTTMSGGQKPNAPQ